MNTIRCVALPAILCLALTLAPGLQQKDPGVLLRAAIETEDVVGDLRAAIEQYARVLELAGANRVVAARALLRLGGCHEKLGQQEARRIYERLVAEYPDQTAEAAAARARLAALRDGDARPAPQATFRQLQMPGRLESPATFSPDGARLAFVSDGSVWVVPAEGPAGPNVTGAPVRLTEPAMGAQLEVAWSGDGAWLAFNGRDGVYTIPSSGGTPRKVPLDLQRRGTHPFQFRLGLSRDGSDLALTAAGAALDESAVHVVGTRGGSPRRISPAGGAMPAFSPDGQRVAFVTFEAAADPKDELRGRVWVVPARGGEPVLVDDARGSAEGPVWSPDGTAIAFLQRALAPDGSERRDLRIVPVGAGGGPLGDPVRLDLRFPSQTALIAGWTSKNEIALSVLRTAQEAIYTVPAGGGRATQVSPKGWAAHPRWSPDGRRIFLRWDDGDIAFVPAEGGPVTTVAVERDVMKYEAVPGGGNAVSPDGTTLAFAGTSQRDGRWTTNIWTVPVAGGRPAPITSYATPDTRFPCWSPDGGSIAFVARDEPDRAPQPDGMPVFQIYSVSSEGGEPRKLTTAAHGVGWAGLAWSPDGRWIAYFTVDRKLAVLPAGGGERRVVVDLGGAGGDSPPGPAAMRQFEMAWSPDGRKLAYAFGGGLWTVDLAGGEPSGIRTGLSSVQPTKLDWSPDGKTIAFTGYEGGDYELWLVTPPPVTKR